MRDIRAISRWCEVFTVTLPLIDPWLRQVVQVQRQRKEIHLKSALQHCGCVVQQAFVMLRAVQTTLLHNRYLRPFHESAAAICSDNERHNGLLPRHGCAAQTEVELESTANSEAWAVIGITPSVKAAQTAFVCRTPVAAVAASAARP